MAHRNDMRTEHGGNWDRFTAWDIKPALKHDSARLRRQRQRAELAAYAAGESAAWQSGPRGDWPYPSAAWVAVDD